MGLFRRLVVIESEWWHGYSHSIRPAFEFLSHDVADRSDNFRYERFVGKQSFIETLEFSARQRDARFIYIACHGSSSALHFPDKSSISVSELEMVIERINGGTRIDGLFLGSCLVGRHETAQRLLNSAISAPQRVKWVAGYSEAVSWFDATLLDVLFLRSLLQVEDELTPRASVQRAIQAVKSNMDGLARASKFSVFARQQKSGKIVDLVHHASDYD